MSSIRNLNLKIVAILKVIKRKLTSLLWKPL